MKVVINRCFGGYSLSAQAIAALTELDGKTAHFFAVRPRGKGIGFEYVPVTVQEADSREVFVFSAFDSPDVDFEDDASYSAHQIEIRPDNRSDPRLIQVVERLGEAANGKHARLAIVEIPDGTDFVVDEYDGMEHVAEAHRTWS